MVAEKAERLIMHECRPEDCDMRQNLLRQRHDSLDSHQIDPRAIKQEKVSIQRVSGEDHPAADGLIASQTKTGFENVAEPCKDSKRIGSFDEEKKDAQVRERKEMK